jgi:hypothetical protein
VSGSSIPRLALLALIPTLALAQAQPSPYLLRLEHRGNGANVCVLLQKSGFFHFESDNGDSTKVFEGKLADDGLLKIENDLQNKSLETLTQKQIEEPLIRRRELLQMDISRGDQWQELTFLSAESQEPYRDSLEPLIRWLNDLHKVPHKELSEDAGKNNCLAPSEIVLKKRPQLATRAQTESGFNTAPSPSGSPRTPLKPQTSPPLLHISSLSVKSSVVEQNCFLVMESGIYRGEERSQKVGNRKVDTKITGGTFAPQEMSELRQLLDDPGLAKIRHRKTSQMVLPMSGEMLNLQIQKTSGVQDVVLSSTFHRADIPFFYAGDGDIRSAQPLLKFIAEHVWTAGSGRLDPSLRNNCQSAP